MLTPYLYESKSNPQYSLANSAIIILPDIFGLTDYTKATCEQFLSQFEQQVYVYEYFYSLNSQANVFTPGAMQEAVEMMNRMKGEDFVQPFVDVLQTIQSKNSHITEFIVVGFCFGGRLAYLGGLDERVNKIVSFYGAGSHQPGFYDAQTPLEALCEVRKNDSNLEVLSLYGLQDASISATDRDQTSKDFAKANISYKANEYYAGHAYFQQGRPNYDQVAADESLIVLKKFLR